MTIDEIFKDKKTEKSFVADELEPIYYVKFSEDFLLSILGGYPDEYGFVRDHSSLIVDAETFEGLREIISALIRKYRIRRKGGQKISTCFPILLRKIKEEQGEHCR